MMILLFYFTLSYFPINIREGLGEGDSNNLSEGNVEIYCFQKYRPYFLKRECKKKDARLASLFFIFTLFLLH